MSTSVASAVAERAAHDLPLDRVGVLELVDERDAVALAQPRAAPPRRAARRAASSQPREQVVVGHDAERALAPLELRRAPRAASRRAHRRVGVRPARRRRGSSGAAGLATAARPISQRLARGRTAARRGSVEAADVEVVDDLLDEIGEVLDERRVRARRRRRRRGRASTSWQKPCVVAIVAASKSASAAASRRAAQLDLGVGPSASSRATASSGRRRAPASARASPCSAPTSRSRTRSRSSPVAIRVNVTTSSCVERRCPRRRSGRPARRSCRSCRCRRSPRAR